MRGTSNSECSGDNGKAAIHHICLQTDAGAQCRDHRNMVWPIKHSSMVTNGCVMINAFHWSTPSAINAGGNADTTGLSAGNQRLPYIRI
jgi:hypothetical protein